MARAFPCYLVSKDAAGQIHAALETRTTDDLAEGDVLIEAAFSSINYKDALAATGHPGVARVLPHVPGIDVAGTVLESSSPKWTVGDQVLVTGYGLGEDRWGGWAGCVRVPSDWIVPLPPGLSLLESMTYGTAGFTAAQSVQAIEERRIDPARGPVLVTGASGGVGTFAVALLAKAGYEVVAVTGKAAAHDYLRALGATKIIGRSEVIDTSSRPLLSAKWSAAIDTVGGPTLGTVLRSTMHRGVVAACGLVGGAEIPLTVFPFILRGVTLAGIDSAQCPMGPRLAIWSRLATSWKVSGMERLAKLTELPQVAAAVERVLAGDAIGRFVVIPRA